MSEDVPGEGVPMVPGAYARGKGLGAVSFQTAFVQPILPKPEDFDELGHINNVVYLSWAQTIATKHWYTVAPQALVETYIFVALRHEVDYRDPILPGDAIEARTWLGAARGPRFDRYVDIRKPGAKRASASVLTQWCMIEAATHRPKRVGPDVLDAFQVPG